MKQIRCAVYTRKSSEEGLDQSFNSLDAQREACLAYILSQKHEGWVPVQASYDDGGYSGGSMERPSLKALLADIEARKVDIIVVYKVDRLTRALSDFAKMVELFDKHGVSFVSVTQQFNTTTSMGRLTLNVLLSFAQFEREVTGERIRDKIAASKRKGIWMGGVLPLGYDVKNRELVVNEKEAEKIRHIFKRYVALKSVSALKTELDRDGIRSKARKVDSPKMKGDSNFSLGALYTILTNRIYLGEIKHRKNSFPGNHQAILSKELWNAAQETMAANRRMRKAKEIQPGAFLLTAKLVTDRGTKLTPVHTQRHGKRYRYYAEIRKPSQSQNKEKPWRVPAHELETLVTAEISRLLEDKPRLLSMLGLSKSNGLAQLTAACRQLAGQLDTPSSNKPKILRPLINKVVIAQQVVRMYLNSSQLAIALGIKETDDYRPEFILENTSTIKKHSACSSWYQLIAKLSQGIVIARRY